MNVLFNRDLLYPTVSLFEPGSVHIEVLGPDREAKIPVIIESKSGHSPIKYLNAITNVMQADIFDRIMIDIKKNVSLYIKPGPELAADYPGCEYIKVLFSGEAAEFAGTNTVNE